MDLFGSSKHQASTKINIGSGEKHLFWHDNMNRIGSLKQLAPKLYNIAQIKHIMMMMKEMVRQLDYIK
jgi:hypothetical protein